MGGTGTWDASDTTHWAATSNGAGGQSVPGTGDTATFDGSSGGGTVTVDTTVTIQSLTMGAFTGTLDFATNNNNVTLSATTGFSATGTGARTLNMGDGTWTLSAASSPIWDCNVVTNFTLNANGSTIALTNTAPSQSRFFLGGGKTYNIVNIASTTTGFAVVISGNNTFAQLNISASVNIAFNQGSTQTVTGAFTWTGSSSKLSAFYCTGTAGATIVATGGGTISWAALFGITFTTGTVDATSSYNLGSMAGVTITEPAGGGGMLVNPGMSGRLV